MSNVLSQIENKLNLYGLRHQKIAQNIQNADIPDARAIDLDFSKLIDQNHSVKLKITNINHINISSPNAAPKVVLRKGEKNINGNDIDIKFEAAAMTSNAEDSKIAADILKELWKLIKIPLGNN